MEKLLVLFLWLRWEIALKAGLSTSRPLDLMVSEVDLSNPSASALFPGSQQKNEMKVAPTLDLSGDNAQASFLAWIKGEMRKEITEALRQAFTRSLQ